MLAGLLLAVLSVGPPLSATEGALTRKAGQQAQWSAFRGAMAPEAWLLDPDLQPATLVLGRRADPAQARTWPGRSLTSCDGSLAVSTGPVRLAEGVDGRFLTVWERQPDRSWRWIFDGTVQDDAPAADGGAGASTAACGARPAGAIDPAAEAAGSSADGTLRWTLVRAADRDGHRLVVDYATGTGWATFTDATIR